MAVGGAEALVQAEGSSPAAEAFREEEGLGTDLASAVGRVDRLEASRLVRLVGREASAYQVAYLCSNKRSVKCNV